MKRLIATAAVLIMVPAWAATQDAEHPYRGQGYLVVGFGTGTGFSYNHPFFKQVGGGGEGFLSKGLGFGAELTYVNWGGYDNQAWVASSDFSYHLRRRAACGVDPFVLGGASLVVPTHKGGGRGSVAPNFGGGASFWLSQRAALRLEFRDIAGSSFWTYDHYLSFRVGLTLR